MAVQMRSKIAAYAAVFLFAGAALPASAASLTPVSYAVDLQGSSTSTLFFQNNQSTTQTSTGVTTYNNPPSAYSVNAYTAGVQNSVASVHSSVSYPPLDPTVSASASAGSLPTGTAWLGNASTAELHVNVSGNISYQYAFEVASLNVVHLPVIVNVQGAITLSGSRSTDIGNYFTSTAAITFADQHGAILKTYSFTNSDGNGPTYLTFNKHPSILTNTEYLVTLYVSAQAGSYSFYANNFLGSATAFAEIDPTVACDPADPNCVGTTIIYSSGLTTPLPSTWLMLLSGFVGLGFFAYRGAKKNAATLAAA